MLSSKILAVCLLSVCSQFATCAPTDQKTLIRTFDFPKSDVSFEQRSLDEAKLVYALCSGGSFEKNCKVTQAILDVAGIRSLTCEVRLRAASNDTKIYHKVRVALLSKNRALLLWREGPALKLANLEFDGCRTSEASVRVSADLDDQREIDVAAYEDGYDVFYPDAEVCRKRSCRISFDSAGKVVGPAAAWGPKYEHPYKYVEILGPAMRRSFDKGLFVEVFEIYDKVSQVLVTDNDEKLLVKSKRVDDLHTISTFGNEIGICSYGWVDDEQPGQISHALECKRMNYDGQLVKTELEVNASSIFGVERSLHFISRLNQPEGFILFTIEFEVERPDEISHRAYRIDANGEKVKSVEIADFRCAKEERNYMLRAFENEAGQPCVSFVCDKMSWGYTGPNDRFTMGVRCFADDEL